MSSRKVLLVCKYGLLKQRLVSVDLEDVVGSKKKEGLESELINCEQYAALHAY